MNTIPSLTSTAAALAGTARAASHQLESVANTGAAAANSAASETVDSVDKGNGSGDSGADGRQTLDTFERQKSDSEPEPENGTSMMRPDCDRGEVLRSTTTSHLDFMA